MNKIALVTDSTCDLNQQDYEKYNVHVLPLKIVYSDRQYTDRVDITPEEVYKNMEVEVPTTSLPSMEEIDALFVKLKKEGYTHVVVITISTGLSGTHNSIRLVSENHPEMKFEIFDSRALSLGSGAIVLECGKMIQEGKSFEEIVETLPTIREKISVFYVVDTLKYLIKGGRIGKVSGSIGQALNIKPVISINEEGVCYTYSKVRGRKKSLNKIYDLIKEKLDETEAKVWIIHGGAKEEAVALYERLENHRNLISVNISDVSPVAGVHSGPGLLGVAIMDK